MIVLKSSSHLALSCARVCEIYIYIKCSSWKSFLTVPLLFILCAEVWSQKNSTSAHIESSLTLNKFKTHPLSFSRTHARSFIGKLYCIWVFKTFKNFIRGNRAVADRCHTFIQFLSFFFRSKKKTTHRERICPIFWTWQIRTIVSIERTSTLWFLCPEHERHPAHCLKVSNMPRNKGDGKNRHRFPHSWLS